MGGFGALASNSWKLEESVSLLLLTNPEINVSDSEVSQGLLSLLISEEGRDCVKLARSEVGAERKRSKPELGT